jgi:hypothetical protein
MSKSTTTFVALCHLARLGDLAPVILRLMMACNDFSIANDAFGQWSAEQSRTRKDRQLNARLYFLRVQIAHVYEALSIINEVQRKPLLLAAVRRCDARTQQSYDRLVAHLATSQYKIMRRLRNKITFHYDPTIACAGLMAIAANHPDQQTIVRMGDAALDWYFEAADIIVGRTVVRQIFNISLTADARAEADKIVLDLQDIANTFGDFAGYFIKHHTGR